MLRATDTETAAGDRVGNSGRLGWSEDGEEGDLEGVDGAVVRGRDLLAVGERERGGAARAGEGLEAPRAQLPAFPPLGLLAPHPLWRQTRACMVSVAANGERRWGARPEGERRRTPHGAIGPLPR